MKNLIGFVTNFTSDILLLLGVLLIVVASLIAYGLVTFLFVLGGFFVVGGIIGRYFEN